MRRIKIEAGAVAAFAALNETKTADAVWSALPLEARGSTWGAEIYFIIPVTLPEDCAQEVVDVGDLGYWPPGKAFCIFFGPTPASTGTEVRPASPVNVFGRLEGDARAFQSVRSGATVRVSKAP